jgi:4-amino-4-deoxy-L-arabinose transferase-like glycosyltransferase
LLEIDEAIYAEVAREAFVSGDYFSTYYNFETEFSKPPFQYWLLQISYAIFGINEWAVRLPSFIMAVGVLFLTYRFGKNIRSPDAGLWACLILCANPGFYGMIRDARMDITLTFFITLSIYGFYVYVYKKTEENLPFIPSLQRRGMGWSDSFKGFLYIYVGMAGATLTKGPIGIIFPSLIIFAFIILRRDWNTIRNLKPFYGLLLLMLLITPWYIYMTKRYGFGFLEKNIIHENFKKFLVKGVYEPNPGGHFFLAHTFLWYFFPWWILWFYQQYLWARDVRRLKPAATKERDIIIYLLLWFYIPLIFFSLSKYSLPNYLGLIIPAASLGAGLYIDSNKEKIIDKFSLTVEYIFSLSSIPLLIIILVSAFSFFKESLNITVYLLIAGAIASVSLILISVIYKNFLLAKSIMVILVMIIQLFISASIQPILDTYKPAKPISEAIKKVSGKEFEIGFYKTRLFQSLVFYTGKKINGFGSEDSMLQFINSPKERFVITEENEYNLLPQDYRNEMVVLGRFPYFPISRISYSFLNPKTREEVIKYIVLIGKKQYA